MANKCVYCNSETVTKSDIIPYAITEAKLVKKIVCGEHNSHTNCEFEKSVIKQLDIFRKEMGLKRRDGSEIKVDTQFRLGSDIFDINYSEHIFLHENQIFLRNEEKVLIQSGTRPVKGLLELYEEYPEYEGKGPEHIIKYTLEEIFATDDMKRTLAKIAYEWHCSKNNINGYSDKYNEIVNYIISGQCGDICRIELVNDMFMYKVIGDVVLEPGTNAVYEYYDNDGRCNVIFFLWNVIAYKITIGNGFAPTTDFSFMQEIELYHIDGSIVEKTFGVMSIDQNYNVQSVEINKGLKTIGNFLSNRLMKTLLTKVYSGKNLYKIIKVLKKDFENLRRGRINAIQFIKYGEKERLIIISFLLELNKNKESYNYEMTFNNNMTQIFDGEYIDMSDLVIEEHFKKINALFESGKFSQVMDESLNFINSLPLY